MSEDYPIVHEKYLNVDCVATGNVPVRFYVGDAGYDLFANENTIIPSKGVGLVHTGLYLAIPSGYVGDVRSRSGLALKSQVFVLNSPGTIDTSYRGEIGVILYNLGNKDFCVSKGDRVAQLVIIKCESVNFNIVDNISETDRKTNGFGSTGMKPAEDNSTTEYHTYYDSISQALTENKK